ncbi:MAG: GtrA family protein [Clostridia bacterium]|nr:GtrA family protein [Clostridia bacterium]
MDELGGLVNILEVGFHSKATDTQAIVKEIVSFFACRIATGVVDWVCMFLFVEVLHFNDVVIKVFANIFVIILNYIASKLIIFRKR